MGKRKSGKGGLTGLSGFVLNAFKQPENTQNEVPQPTGSVAEPNVGTPEAVSTPQAQRGLEGRPMKRQKTKAQQDTSYDAHGTETWDPSGSYVEKYDATGLVPHYTKASEVPEHLKKYFSQRYRYFSLYAQGCLLDEEGWYSVTPELVAEQIAERCRCDTILDAFCGVGGNAIAFARTCQRVIALDTSPTRLALARHNAQIYGVADRIEFILSDYIPFAKAYLSHSSTFSASGSQSQNTHASRKIDVVFLSPPWGGPSYLLGTNPTSESIPVKNPAAVPIEAHPTYSLSSILPIPGDELFALTRKITPNIAYYLPRNTSLDQISQLLCISDRIRTGDLGDRKDNGMTDGDTGEGGGEMVEKNDATEVQLENHNTGLDTTEAKTPRQAQGHLQESVEVEEEWMGSKLKALTCYFGGLAAGQEELY